MAQPDDNDLLTLPVDEFVSTYRPGEYDTVDDTWAEVLVHPAFLEPNPFNPDRVHAGTWGAFVSDVAANGITNPVIIDWYDDRAVAEGHHRVVAALLTGQPVPFRLSVEPARGGQRGQSGPSTDGADQC